MWEGELCLYFCFLDLLLTLLLFLQFFFRGEVGELADVREEGNRFADSRCSCLGDVDCMATVMVWGSADISSVLSVRLPCSALCGDFENQDFCSWWRHWFLVVVVDPVQESVGRDAGLHGTTSHHVQRPFCLWD